MNNQKKQLISVLLILAALLTLSGCGSKLVITKSQAEELIRKNYAYPVIHKRQFETGTRVFEYNVRVPKEPDLGPDPARDDYSESIRSIDDDRFLNQFEWINGGHIENEGVVDSGDGEVHKEAIIALLIALQDKGYLSIQKKQVLISSELRQEEVRIERRTDWFPGPDEDQKVTSYEVQTKPVEYSKYANTVNVEITDKGKNHFKEVSPNIWEGDIAKTDFAVTQEDAENIHVIFSLKPLIDKEALDIFWDRDRALMSIEHKGLEGEGVEFPTKGLRAVKKFPYEKKGQIWKVYNPDNYLPLAEHDIYR